MCVNVWHLDDYKWERIRVEPIRHPSFRLTTSSSTQYCLIAVKSDEVQYRSPAQLETGICWFSLAIKT